MSRAQADMAQRQKRKGGRSIAKILILLISLILLVLLYNIVSVVANLNQKAAVTFGSQPLCYKNRAKLFILPNCHGSGAICHYIRWHAYLVVRCGHSAVLPTDWCACGRG